jgi:hypothetical protein
VTWRDVAATDPYATSCRERKNVEMLFTHLKRIPSSTAFG